MGVASDPNHNVISAEICQSMGVVFLPAMQHLTEGLISLSLFDSNGIVYRDLSLSFPSHEDAITSDKKDFDRSVQEMWSHYDKGMIHSVTPKVTMLVLIALF